MCECVCVCVREIASECAGRVFEQMADLVAAVVARTGIPAPARMELCTTDRRSLAEIRGRRCCMRTAGVSAGRIWRTDPSEYLLVKHEPLTSITARVVKF